MINRKLFISVGVACAFLVTGCSGNFWGSRNKLDEHPLSKFGRKKEIDDARESKNYDTAADAGSESFVTLGEGGGLLGGGGGRATKNDVRMDKLYSGAVDVTLELPITVADRNGGFISTDWKVNPNDPTTRYRLNIHVTGREPYGEVAVAVLRQQKVGDTWQDRPSDPELASQIEKAIRKRAQLARP